jgi:D-galactose 1-dehydrogenase
MVYNIVIVGYGEIARLAHHPVLLSRSDTNVVGLVDVNFTKDEVVSSVDASTHFKKAVTSASTSTPTSNPLRFASISDVFHYFDGNIDAMCICTPKTVTLSAATECLTHASASNALRGILLEKPPGECVEELQKVVQMATLRKVLIFTACHTTACPARVHCDAWLADKERRLKSINITWKENVRKWHQGQKWISTTSGGGVTDMLFNPLSLIVSQFGLEPKSIRLIQSDLIRPCNWEAAVSGSAEFMAQRWL